MSVVAGVIVREKVIELSRYVGQVMDTPQPMRPTAKFKSMRKLCYQDRGSSPRTRFS
jgi:hypothetical protein